MTVWVSGSATAVGCVGRLEDMFLWPVQRWDTLASLWVLGACASPVAVSLGLRRLAHRCGDEATPVVCGGPVYIPVHCLCHVAVHALVRRIARATRNLTGANVFDTCSVSIYRAHNWAETRRRRTYRSM